MRYTDGLRWGIVGIFCTLLFVPFIIGQGGLFPNMFFPFITAKNFTFRILVEIMLGLYVLLALKDPKYRPRGSVLLWSMLAFVAWVGIATIVSVDPIKSFWSNFERMEGYIGTLHLAALFIIAGAVLAAEQWWEKFFKLSIVVATLQGFYALFQLLGWAAISTQSGARLDTSFGNATYLAAYMLFNIFITLFILTKERHSRFMQAVYGISLALQGTALFYTQTRGAILGFVGGMILAALYVIWKGRHEQSLKTLRKVAIGGIVALIVVGAGLVALKDSAFVKGSPVLNRLASISFADKTTQSRFMIWNMAGQGFLERPIAGWGQENFSYVFNKYYDPGMYAQEQWFDRAHNQFLDWLLAAGLPAFLLFISFFLLAAWAVHRSDLPTLSRAVLIGLLGGYGFHSMFVFDNLISAMYLFLVLAYCASLLPRKVPRFMFLSRPMGDHGVAIAAPVALVAVIGSIWFFNVPGITRAQTIINAITTQEQRVVNGAVTTAPRDPKDNLEQFQNALALGSLGKQEVVEQLYQFASAAAGNASLSPDLKEEIYTVTRAEGEKLLQERPGDARLELFYAIFLNQFGKHDEALQAFDRALMASPQKQQILFQLGLTYIAVNQLDKALEALKAAFDAEPSYEEARIYYAMGLYYADRPAEGDKILIEGFGSTIVDNERLLQFYLSRNMKDRVIGIMEKRVETNPNDAQLRVSLAAAYFETGNKAKTIATLKEAAQIEPSLAAQIQTLITQIENGTLVPNP